MAASTSVNAFIASNFLSVFLSNKSERNEKIGHYVTNRNDYNQNKL